MPVDFSPLVKSQPNLLRMFDDIQAQKRADELQKMTAYQFLRQKQEDELKDKERGAYVIDETGAFNPQATLANLLRVNPKAAMDFQASITKQKQDAQKLDQDNQTFNLNKAEKVGNMIMSSAKMVYANPTLANAMREINRIENYTGEDLSNEKEALQQIGENREGIQKWSAAHFAAATDLMPKFKDQDIGGAINALSIDPITGKATVLSTTQKTATPDALMTDKRAREEGAANRGVTIRGQNMTDARSREANASGGKPPAGYRWAADGTLEAIKGGPADKSQNPTEVQGKAALFSSRALEADKILRSVEGKYSTLGLSAKNTVDGIPGLSALSNSMLSTETQKADQAQRDFVNAILRQESGAAIGQSEFDNARKQYFPQPGDSKEVIKQKSLNRQTAIRGLNTMAGPLGKRGGATGDFDAPSSNVVDFGSLK